MILSLPLGASQEEDSLLWYYDKRGIFSMKSGYKVGAILLNRNGPSGSSDNSWWFSLWKFNVPPKIRCFIWKAYRNQIPVFLNLAGRGVPITVWCHACRNSPETVLHALWSCNRLKKIRSACHFIDDLGRRDNTSFRDFFLFFLHHLNKDELDILCVVF